MPRLFRCAAMCQAAAMINNVIVWDLETVPDLPGYAAANGLSTSTDDEVREAIGDKFPNISITRSSASARSSPIATTGPGWWMRLARRMSATEPKSN